MAKAKRRGSGEGSIFQRRDGRWVASVDASKPGAKRRLVCTYHPTQAEAVDGLFKLS